ncbi:hypothetical protein GOBAR_DD32120 [Gossypium barbadense]|nr:hypothetical protein GOBAR_DD32120 [Gossypium barbadense]
MRATTTEGVEQPEVLEEDHHPQSANSNTINGNENNNCNGGETLLIGIYNEKMVRFGVGHFQLGMTFETPVPTCRYFA